MNLLIAFIVALLGTLLAPAECLPLLDKAQELNQYPIVLCHGLLGWGPEEMFGLKYWGGISDPKGLEHILTDAGYKTFTGVVGPVSSTWDRAVELYYYIKGGTVDYGEAHATQYNHARYGRTFPGVYPEFGETDAAGDIKKIHVMGHSMGGTTVRLLAHLLTYGSEGERQASGDNVSDLFKGGKPWVHSVTTVSTPHDGSTALEAVDNIIQFLKEFVLFFAAFSGLPTENLLYDFKLEQFGIYRKDGEAFTVYMDRVFDSAIFQDGYQDISLYDLSPEGSRKLNELYPADPNIYYFSYSSTCTYDAPITDKELPKATMWFFLWPFSFAMGRYLNLPDLDKAYWPNDGLVSLPSQRGPSLNSHDQIVDYDGTAVRGKYNAMSSNDATDHIQAVGFDINLRGVSRFYLDMASLLRSLPVADDDGSVYLGIFPEMFLAPPSGDALGSRYFKHMINQEITQACSDLQGFGETCIAGASNSVDCAALATSTAPTALKCDCSRVSSAWFDPDTCLIYKHALLGDM